jgi:hypothetical protein
MTDPIVFKDIAKQEAVERKRLEAKKQDFLRRGLEEEAGKIAEILRNPIVDASFIKIQEELRQTNQPVGDHDEGKFPSQQDGGRRLTRDEKTFAGIYGILLADRQAPPPLDDRLMEDRNVDNVDEDEDNQKFIKAIARARGEYNAHLSLFDASLPIIVKEGDKRQKDEVETRQWAQVVRALADRGIGIDNTVFPLQVIRALSSSNGIGEDEPPSSIDIDLPDLEKEADLEILASNLHAMQALYFSASLEELKLFQVVEKLVELFQQGMLPLGRGAAGDQLYDYWKKSVERMTEVERRNLYARTFGFPGGDGQVDSNREFSDLWLRFVSAVSEYSRQVSIDDLLRARTPFSVSQEVVRKSGRDLAANLSLHGYGVAYFAATELQDTINQSIEILSDPEVKTSFGARDMFQVIDQVASLELGGARNSIRYRTMAQSGAVIIRWLANHAEQLAAAAGARILDVDEIRSGALRAVRSKPTKDPSDQDLVDACEQWLAVTGTSDQSVEQYAQPAEGPNMTSRPVQIPAVARDLLASVGVPTNGKSA